MIKEDEAPSAAIIIIGNEILSGRTADINTQEIALRLGEIGIPVIETRIIADDRQMIIKTVRDLCANYSYVFTTGGIGPTHDDITAEAVSAAVDAEFQINKEIYELVESHYKINGEGMNKAREKMTYFPVGAKMLHSDVTSIPGFAIKNVFVMAGIPSIMKSMLQSAIPMLQPGKIINSKTLDLYIGESVIAERLEDLQNKYSEVDMGSYPFKKNNEHAASIVLRSKNYDQLDKAYEDLKKVFAEYLSS